MAKTQTAATRLPTDYATGAPILFDREQQLSKMINWTGWLRPVVYASMVSGADGWDTANSKGYHNIYFVAGYVTRFSFAIKIQPDGPVNIDLGAVCEFAAGAPAETGTIRWTVNGAPATQNYTNADNGTELVVSLAKTITGTGWQLCTIEITQTGGVGVTNELRRWRIQDQRQTAALPDPVSE